MRIETLKTKIGSILTSMLRSGYAEYDRAKFGTAGTPIHDACTSAYLLRPNIFTFKSVNVQVETESPITRGHTSVDYWQMTNGRRDTEWAIDVDSDAFFDLMIDRISAYKD